MCPLCKCNVSSSELIEDNEARLIKCDDVHAFIITEKAEEIIIASSIQGAFANDALENVPDGKMLVIDARDGQLIYSTVPIPNGTT
jgi:hypothetical protein